MGWPSKIELAFTRKEVADILGRLLHLYSFCLVSPTIVAKWEFLLHLFRDKKLPDNVTPYLFSVLRRGLVGMGSLADIRLDPPANSNVDLKLAEAGQKELIEKLMELTRLG